MKLTIIIGMTQQGKSRFTKTCIGYAEDGRKINPRAQNNCFVFDVNNEYTWLPMERADENLTQSRYFGDFNTFVNKCAIKRNNNIVFEEATGYLKGNVGKKITQLIIGKAHTKNNYFLLFHTINSVPPEIIGVCNYVILFKTMDEPKNIKKSMNFLIPQAAWIKKQPDHTRITIKTI